MILWEEESLNCTSLTQQSDSNLPLFFQFFSEAHMTVNAQSSGRISGPADFAC